MSEYCSKDIHNGKKDSISSGETEKLEAMQFKWSTLYGEKIDEKEEKRYTEAPKWTYEQVIEGDPTPFLEAIGKIEAIPAYRYVINYLLLKTELGVGTNNRRNFAEFIAQGKFPNASAENIEEKRIRLLSHERGEEEKVFDQHDFQDLWQIMTSGLDDLFWRSGYQKKMDWGKFFSGVVDSFCYDSLKQLALGIHMPLEDFNVFLKKVLKRSGINFYNRDEIFVYLTLKYADRYGSGAYYQAYKKLCQLYPKKAMKEKKPEEQPEWEDIVSTKFLGQKLEESLNGMSGTLFEKPDAKLEKFLEDVQWQNMRLKDKENKDMMRTAQRRFLQLWDKLKEIWDKSEQLSEIIRSERETRKAAQMAEAIRSEREAQKKAGTDEDAFYKELTVIYNPETGCMIPAGMRFEAETEKASAEGNRTAVFKMKEEQVLPAVKTELVEVKVKALMLETEFNKIKESIPTPKDIGQFVGKNFFEELEKMEPEIKFSKIRVCSEELKKRIEDIQINGSVRFAEGKKKGNKGTLLAACRIGTRIPKGTRFCFEIEGVKFQYESLEDVQTEGTTENPCIAAKIKTVWENVVEFQRAATGKDCKFLSSKAEFSFDGEILKNVYKIYAEKRTVLNLVDNKAKDHKVDNIPVFHESYDILNEKNTDSFGYDETKDYLAGDSFMFRQIYDTSNEKNAGNSGYYEGFPEYGKDYFLNSKIFKDTRITQNHLTKPIMNEERLRNLILTLKFLEYVWWDEKFDEYDADCMDFVMEDFLIDNGTDAELAACGFHSFSIHFPYDAFIALLLNSYDPLGLFQAVWSDKCLLRKEKEK